MNKYPIIVIVVIIMLIPCRAVSQSESSYLGSGRLHLHNPSVTAGFHVNAQYNRMSPEHFRAILPSSELFSKEYPDLEMRDQYFWYLGYTPLVVSASLGMMITDHSGEEMLPFPKLRFGITYYGGSMLSARFYKEDKTRIDTTLLPGTGQILYVDSVHRTSLTAEHLSEQLFLDLGLEFSTSSLRRLSFRSGLGVSGGLPLMSYSKIDYSDDHLRVTSIPGGKTVSSVNEGSVRENEVLTEGSFWVLMPYIPVVVDLRLGSVDKFFGQLFLRYEGRAALRMVMAGAGDTPVSLRRHHSLGLALRW
jgi:hypothetical protein